jgi:hypothetical protein
MLRAAPRPSFTAVPAVLPRLALALAPLLVALTFAFAAFHGYRAVLAASVRNWPFALFYAVLAVGGLALSLALLGTHRRARAHVRRQPDA